MSAHFLPFQRPALHLLTALLIVFGIGGQVASAAVHVETTRVIYSGNAASAALTLSNRSTLPYMVQTWLDDGDGMPEGKDLPMLLTPPLMQLSAGEQAVLRAIYSGTGLPQDRESLFWVNVQEIPPRSEASNVLQVAIRTRIKLFYRPAALDTTLEEAAHALQWRMAGDQLQVTNRSSLHITFAELQGQATAGPERKVDLDMIAPGQSMSVPAAALDLHGRSTLRFSYINDFGGITELADVAVTR
ncbi:molecular chaperone [Stenotrophomonas terrae]|uniref:fimbrial biogenesis chaperone n=1 Tax=Stenotrophomonas terrae TaxID=405446 RepID=UPI00320AF908